MFEAIGKATIDFEKLPEAHYEWMSMVIRERHSKDGNDHVWKHIYATFHDQRSEEFKLLDKLYKHFIPRDFHKEEAEGWRREQSTKVVSDIAKRCTKAAQYDVPLTCVYLCEHFAIVSIGGGSYMMLPPEVVSVQRYVNYDALTAPQRQAMLSGSIEASAETDLTVTGTSLAECRSTKLEAESKMAKLKQAMKDVEDAKTANLAGLQAQIDELMAKLTAEKSRALEILEKKKAEMEEMLERMGMQIYQLESEIYLIRCYTGEVIEFHQIRKGQPAPVDTPVVFHQKLKYLDEELGKLASLYSIPWGKHEVFDDLLRYSPVAFENFAPTWRSIMLVQFSRSGYDYHAMSDGYGSILEDYEIFHGKKICIILRDGENLWLAWTDDEKILIHDDNAFLKPSGPRPMTETEEARFEKDQYESDKDYEKRLKRERLKELKQGVSRYFVYAILQGVLDRGMIRFPEKVNVQKPTPYIVLSVAENWITDNRYGGLADMIERANSDVAVGDMVLTVQSAHPGGKDGWSGKETRYDKWLNDRGIGSRNRTHDVDAEDRTIYPVNKVNHYAQYRFTLRERNNPQKTYQVERALTEAEFEEYKRGWAEELVRFEKLKDGESLKVYVSLKKEKNWYTGAQSTANFELYNEDFWNLTYLNSVWLTYVLTNQKTSGIRFGGSTVDFKHVIPYINTALDHVRKREEKFAAWMEKVFPGYSQTPEWPALLSEWMLEKKYHNFSEFRAKQFVKWLKERKNNERS